MFGYHAPNPLSEEVGMKIPSWEATVYTQVLAVWVSEFIAL
jgi:hypothetical protein